MSIQITSHRNAVSLFNLYFPKTFSLVFITDPKNPFAMEGTSKLPGLAKDFLMLSFNDITYPSEGLVVPTREHVARGLEFSEGMDDLIVCCHAGVSRSAAMAYVIQSKRTDPADALSILDVNVHFPNLLIVKHGSELLGKPEMVSLIEEFQKRATNEIDPRQWQIEAMKRQHGIKP